MTLTTTEHFPLSLNDFSQCRWDEDENCPRQFTGTGYCARHTSTMRARLNRTSDGVNTGRRPKLTDAQIAEARQMVSRFKSPKDIAKKFGVSVETIRRVTR